MTTEWKSPYEAIMMCAPHYYWFIAIGETKKIDEIMLGNSSVQIGPDAVLRRKFATERLFKAWKDYLEGAERPCITYTATQARMTYLDEDGDY